MFEQVKTGLLLISALAVAACSTAPGPAVATRSAASTTETKLAANTQEKKICRREIATGSVMPKVVCRTRAEWDRLMGTGLADKDVLDSQRRSRGMVSGNRGD